MPQGPVLGTPGLVLLCVLPSVLFAALQELHVPAAARQGRRGQAKRVLHTQQRGLGDGGPPVQGPARADGSA